MEIFTAPHSGTYWVLLQCVGGVSACIFDEIVELHYKPGEEFDFLKEDDLKSLERISNNTNESVVYQINLKEEKKEHEHTLFAKLKTNCQTWQVINLTDTE